ncbi:23S rRNA (uracil(1939)-C(5))-methyltransferase RlmD [Psychromonas sp. CD1]|uniref:23S rRNA (uracil(1939)-C(5))-methyltransferase RlmD n=1 Tax=Psychromonas sp. CD1 TaxID=1979839 RepID=UPI000B9C5F3A|nr:23S rRNA (uracil(1939)-C(5))-methyltransferase RlmD [Psychromonas sp. CD1]
MAQFFKAIPKNSTKNRIYKNIKIEKLDHQGRGMGHVHGKPIFIEGVLLDECVDVQVSEDKKRYLKGSVKRINTMSTLRISPDCLHYKDCGGCQLQHIDQSTQIQIKEAGLGHLFKRFAKLSDIILQPFISGSPWGYRRTARFGLQYDRKRKELDMGFRFAQTNKLIKQKVCPVLLPQLEKLIVPLYALLNSLQIKEHLGHVELLESEQGVVILLRHLKAFSEKDIICITNFAKAHQLNFFIQAQANEFKLCSGEHKLSYSLPEWHCKFIFAATDFLQVNAEVNKKMVAQALQWLALEADDRVLDLFCGLGNFTLPIARQVKTVVGVEGVQKMVDRATENARLNHISNSVFYQADLNNKQINKQIWAQQKFSKVLLDPARAGALNCMEFIASLQVSHIVYISCDAVTLARDSSVLLENGYKLDKLGLLDMFPQTKHMESMALFLRC